MIIKIGNSVSIRAKVTDASGAIVTNLQTASGIRFMVKNNREDLNISALISKTNGAGIIVDSPATGWLTIDLSNADTLIPVGIKYFGIQVEYLGGVQEVFVKENGKIFDEINFIQDVIR